MSPEYLEQLRKTLVSKGIELDPGLSDEEIDRIESDFGFRFPPDYRAVLQAMLPVSEGFPNWRSGNTGELIEWLDSPAEGIAFEVEENDFWLPQWGERPEEVDDAIEEARRLVSAAPVLIPVFSHRFIPARPADAGNPVFSVVDADVICYGADLQAYFHEEFDAPMEDQEARVPKKIEFWSELVELEL